MVLCGRGNNGGDGLVAARYLAEAGCAVSVVILGDPTAAHGEVKVNLDRLPVTPIVIEEEAGLYHDGCKGLLERAQLFVDAVLGTGFRPPMRGLAIAGRNLLERYPQIPVVAVDLPSGWDADAREFFAPDAYRADAVVTFTAPKLAHVSGMLTRGATLPGNHQQGPIVVAPIGSPAEAVESATGLIWAGSSKAIADRPRSADSNKGRFGHVLVIGGARGKSGAPCMSSVAALRAGAGLVTAAIAQSILPTVAAVTPELMTHALLEGAQGEISSRNLEPALLDPVLEKKSVIAVGPGMGQEEEAVKFFLGLLERTKVPMVIDADALNALAANPGKLNGRGRLLVLTPHPGEMARLAGMSIQRGGGRQGGHCPAVRDQPCGHPGAQRLAHAHRPSGWPHRHQHHRQPGHGQGRKRGYFDRDRRCHDRSISRAAGRSGGSCDISSRTGSRFCGTLAGSTYFAGHGHGGASL